MRVSSRIRNEEMGVVWPQPSGRMGVADNGKTGFPARKQALFSAMVRVAWLSDIHFEHLESQQIDRFLIQLEAKQPDLILIGGDISRADRVADDLKQILDRLQRPTYFVLGNHDYYGGSINEVRCRIRALCQEFRDLIWLPDTGVISLTDSVALTGHGCWGDGRCGDFYQRPDLMTDYFIIEELKELGHDERLRQLNALGDEAADFLRESLTEAFQNHDEVFVLTHVPLFSQSCRYQGQATPADFTPHFVCKAAGDALLEVVESHSENRTTVLSGHTHEKCRIDLLPNLLLIAAGARYGAPTIQWVFEVA